MPGLSGLTGLSGLSGLTSTGAAPASSLLTGITAYWTLDEASGNRADATGNGHTMVPTNAPGSVAGKIGNALSCVAASVQYLTCADAGLPASATDSWSVAGWFNPTGTGDGLLFQVGTGNNQEIYFDGSRIYRYPDLNILAGTIGAWNFFAYTLASTGANAGTETLYLGNALNNPTLLTATRTSPALPAASGTPVAIGAQNGGGLPWHGGIDELGYWKGICLTASQVNSLFNGFVGRTYPFTGAP